MNPILELFSTQSFLIPRDGDHIFLIDKKPIIGNEKDSLELNEKNLSLISLDFNKIINLRKWVAVAQTRLRLKKNKHFTVEMERLKQRTHFASVIKKYSLQMHKLRNSFRSKHGGEATWLD